MAYEPSLIAPFQTGLNLDLDPAIMPPDAFVEAENVHIRHGVLQKRNGYDYHGFIVHGTARTVTGITEAAPGVVTTSVAHGFNDGDQVLLTGVAGMVEVNNNRYTIANAAGTTFSIVDTDTGFTTYTGGGRAILSPSNRIMGIYEYINSDGTRTSLIFDTKRAAKYNGGTHVYDPVDAVDIMSSSNTDYVWAVNWQSTGIVNRLYFTNGKVFDGATLDGIRHFSGGTTTTSFTPDLNPVVDTRQLWGCKLLFVLKQRVIAFHTIERDITGATTTTHPQRGRWCQAQGPSNWDDINPGGGGFVDCPTGGQIISAQALQNQIIVFFTDSVWAFVPTKDPALPFIWQKINDFRSCDGKMASVAFDRYAVGVGRRGIVAVDGVETRRVDERIEDFVDEKVNINAINKVFSIRDYNTERWWILYSDSQKVNSDEIDSALIYDEGSSAYTLYNISLNVLGYGSSSYDYGFDDFTEENNLDYSFNSKKIKDDTFQSFFFTDNKEILLGGDLVGTIYRMESGSVDNGTDVVSTVKTAAWNPYVDSGDECQLGYVDFYVETNRSTKVAIEFFKDSNSNFYQTQFIDFLPNLNYITSITNIAQTNPVRVDAPSHGLVTGDIIYIYGVEGMNGINDLAHTVTVINTSQIDLDGLDGTGFSAYTTGGGLYERKFYKTRIWKRAYTNAVGFQHQIRLRSVGTHDYFEIHKMKIYTRKRGKRTIN